MTEPTYPGSIRDDSTSGIRGLWNQLQLIVAGFNNLLEILQVVIDIRTLLENNLPPLLTRLTYLTGQNAPTNSFGQGGLPTYLGDVVGNRNQVLFRGNSFYDFTDNMETYLRTVQATVQGAANGNTFARNIFLDQYLELVALNAVIGNLSDDVNGATLKSLLSASNANTLRSAVCCETGLIPPIVLPPPTNPAPADFCSLFPDNAIRNMGYTVLAPNQYDLAPRQAYGILWPVFPQISTIESAPPNAPNLGFRGLRSANALDYCLAWNFTGGAVPGQARLHRTNEVWSGDSADGSTTVINLSMQGATALGTGSQDYFGFVIILEAGEPLPANNFFLRYGQTGTV